MTYSSAKKAKGKHISTSPSTAGSAWTEATYRQTSNNSNKRKEISESELLKQKYGGVIGRRYDGRGKLIPARALTMTGSANSSNSSGHNKKDTHITKKQKTEKEAKEEKILEAIPEPQTLPEIVVDDEEEEDSDEDWEEVDLNNPQTRLINEIKSTITAENSSADPLTFQEEPDAITISLDQEDENDGKFKRGKRTINAITKEERHERVLIHQIQLIMLIIHVSIRNKYCSDFELRKFYKKLIPKKILEELHPQSAALSSSQTNVNLSQMVLTRKLLDGLRHLMEVWRGQFKVRSTCSLTMTSWADIYRHDRKIESKIDKAKFVKMLKKFKGSRDLGAQGFCAILRAADIDARLVCSLQPLDFMSNTPVGKLDDENEDEESKEEIPEPSDYPIFWVEVWDPYARKWIAVDPMVQGIVEPASIHRKSKLEPPLSDKSNSMRYVISFTEDGAIRDVTRRYSYFFNAKTRKKRITNTPEGAIWYNNLLSEISKRDNTLFKTDLDTLEDAEMELRNQAEEIPGSIQDFKGHPIYVLKRHLKQNEVLEPCEPCGYLAIKKAGYKKKKNKATGAIVSTAPLEKIYKRSNVKFVRSARGWYQMGRVIKPGEQPKKHVVRKKPSANTSLNIRFTRNTEDGDNDNTYGYDNYSDEENESTALYSLDQTDLYVPPPIVDGKVTRNAYGNIDVYVPSMIPEGGVLLQYPHIAIAAKMVGIDYANAVTGFDFGSKGGKKGGGRGSATARVDGIVIAKEYEEAVRLVYEQMTQEQEEEDRELAIAKALMMWRRYVTALRIKARLERDHGKIEEHEKHQPKVATVHKNLNDTNFIDVEDNAFGTANKDFGGISSRDAEPAGNFDTDNNDESVNFNEDEGGGFINDGGVYDDNESGGGFFSTQPDHFNSSAGGGFVTGDTEVSGGFVPDEDSEGGFITENTDSGAKNIGTPTHDNNHVSNDFQDTDFDENAGSFAENHVSVERHLVKSSDASTVGRSPFGIHESEAIVKISDFEDDKPAIQKQDSIRKASTPSISSLVSNQHAKARLRAFVPQIFDVVVASDANPDDSLEERILKAHKLSSSVNFQQSLSSSSNTQIRDKTDHSVGESAVTLVDNQKQVAIPAAEDTSIGMDDDKDKLMKDSDQISEQEVSNTDFNDIVVISDEEEGEFFPESMSESELYNEYDEED